MDASQLKSLQAPLKERYREKPEAAVVTLEAEARRRLARDANLLMPHAYRPSGWHPHRHHQK